MCAQENRFHHRAGQQACVRVLLGGVVRREKGVAIGQCVFGSMPENEAFAVWNDLVSDQVCNVSIERHLPHADDDAQMAEQRNLFVEERRAIANLGWQGLVAGRCAANDGSDPEIAELHAVIS